MAVNKQPQNDDQLAVYLRQIGQQQVSDNLIGCLAVE